MLMVGLAFLAAPFIAGPNHPGLHYLFDYYFSVGPKRAFVDDEQGQDLIEYTLLMAFVALASAALFLGAGGSIKGIWTTTNSQLAAANTQAS